VICAKSSLVCPCSFQAQSLRRFPAGVSFSLGVGYSFQMFVDVK
jgi:hypothetical protein